MPAADPKGSNSKPKSGPSSRTGIIAVMVVTALMVAFWAWNNRPSSSTGVTANPSGSASASPVNLFGPEVVSEKRILGLPAELKHPVYWAGPEDKVDYELTISADGAVGIRYLPAGTKDTRQRVLTVATYPYEDAYKAMQEPLKASGTVSQVTSSGSLVVADPEQPENGYLVREDMPYLVQAYSPTAKAVWKLLTTDKITPIAG